MKLKHYQNFILLRNKLIYNNFPYPLPRNEIERNEEFRYLAFTVFREFWKRDPKLSIEMIERVIIYFLIYYLRNGITQINRDVINNSHMILGLTVENDFLYIYYNSEFRVRIDLNYEKIRL